MHRLVKNCLSDEGKLYMFVSSLTQSNKKVSHFLFTIPDMMWLLNFLLESACMLPLFFSP